MSRPRSARSVPLALLGALLLALAACGNPAPSAIPAAAAPDGNRRVEVAFAGGAVTGGVQRYAVPVNATVELVVSSDVADEVHLHGYDRKSFVTAGASTTITFAANLTGVFDVELEQRATPLASLQVS
jgi:predicted small lipoprotein YifL